MRYAGVEITHNSTNSDPFRMSVDITNSISNPITKGMVIIGFDDNRGCAGRGAGRLRRDAEVRAADRENPGTCRLPRLCAGAPGEYLQRRSVPWREGRRAGRTGWCCGMESYAIALEVRRQGATGSRTWRWLATGRAAGPMKKSSRRRWPAAYDYGSSQNQTVTAENWQVRAHRRKPFGPGPIRSMWPPLPPSIRKNETTPLRRPIPSRAALSPL